MTKNETKALLSSVVPAVCPSEAWQHGGSETLCFEDPQDMITSGTATVNDGPSGYVHLEILLPPDRAAAVIAYVTRGEWPLDVGPELAAQALTVSEAAE